jgi:hypothetical protein
MTLFYLTALGFALSVVIDIAQRDKKSKRSPEKFCLMFFIRDNYMRIGYSAVTSAIVIMIYHVGSFDLTEYEDYFAVAAGFCPDLIIGWLKRKFGFLKQ